MYTGDIMTLAGIGLIAVGILGILISAVVFSSSKKKIKSNIYDSKE